MTLRKIYCLISIKFGVVLVLASFSTFISNNVELAFVIFAVSLMCASPALASYTSLGLNYDSSIFDKTPESIIQRRKLVKKLLPYFGIAQTVTALSIPGTFLTALIFPYFNPVVMLSGIVVIASGAWLLFCHEKVSVAIEREKVLERRKVSRTV